MSLKTGTLIAILLTLGFCLPGCGQSSQCVDASGNRDREDMCSAVNSHRLLSGAPLLSLDQELSNVAQSHAEDMRRQQFFSHVTPQGETLKDRLVSAGVQYERVGENISYGQSNVNAAMEQWLASTPHRSNILHTSFTRMGVGRSGSFWVQVFAR